MAESEVPIVLPDGTKITGTLLGDGKLQVGPIGIFLEVHDVIEVEERPMIVTGIRTEFVKNDARTVLTLAERAPDTGVRYDKIPGAVSGLATSALGRWLSDIREGAPTSRMLIVPNAKGDEGDYLEFRAGGGQSGRVDALVIRAVIRDGKPVLDAATFQGSGAEVNDGIAAWMIRNPSIS